jgi:transposase
MSLNRKVLTDVQWKAIEPYCLGKVGDPGQTGKDARLFLEGVLWIVRTGSPWRDLPVDFGHWNSVFKRFRRWVKRGAFERIFKALSEDADFEYVMVDGTIVRVHRHGQGAKGGPKIRPSGKAEAV